VTVDPYTGTVLQSQSLTAPCFPGASHQVFVGEYDYGKMDGFGGDAQTGCTTYAYVPQAEVTRYWALATNNALADEAFQSNQSDSFVAHQYLYAGRSCSYPSDVWCIADNANGAAYCGVKKVQAPLINMTTPFPGKENREGPPCKAYTNTIIAEATAAKLTWRYYTYDAESLWGGPSADANCWKKKACAANVITPPATVLTDIKAHQLANLVFVTPEPQDSDHPGNVVKASAGPNWVASVVNAIGKDKAYWKSTAILVTWDDWGGWYDHEPPPAPPFYEDPYEFGFRIPLIVASAYTPAGTVDHTVRNVYGSMLRYVETTFGLSSLQQVDAPGITDDLSGLFDYGAAPKPFVRM
jgi:phospholipase C